MVTHRRRTAPQRGFIARHPRDAARRPQRPVWGRGGPCVRALPATRAVSKSSRLAAAHMAAARSIRSAVSSCDTATHWPTSAAQRRNRGFTARHPRDAARPPQRPVWGRGEVTTKEVLGELHVLPVDMTPQLSKRVAQELVALGWVRDGRVTTGQMKGAYRYVPGEGR